MLKKAVHAVKENNYVVLNPRMVELRISYHKEVVRVLIDKGEYANIKMHRWACRAHKKHGLIIAMMVGNGIGQSLQSHIFNGKPRRFAKIPKDKEGRLDYRKKSLLRFAKDNYFVEVNQDEVELRIFHRNKHIRVLMDKEDQAKVSQYTWHCVYKAGLLRIENIARKNSLGPKTNSLHNVILGERWARIQQNPKDKNGRLDYRKKSLLAEQETYVNTYRLLNKREMELHISKKGRAFRVRFDREDYPRLKEHDWRVWAINKKPGVFSFQTGMPMTNVIFEGKSLRIQKIPVERHGRMDYRKASLLKAFWANEYRVLNEKEIELYIFKQDKEFYVLFDREDHERVKAHRWRGRETKGKIVIVGCQTTAALAKVILQDPLARISAVRTDDRGRLDFRKKSLLAVTASCSNRYRMLNDNEVELYIIRQGKEFCVLFDRKDYRRVKARHWICNQTPMGAVVSCAKTRTALTKVVLKDPSARVWKINRDNQGRLDYRKASLLAETAAYANDYHVLNGKEVELCISKPGKKFRILFDREDYDRIKERYWRCRSDGGIICAETKAPMAKVILEDPSVHVGKIPRDEQGRMDFRKKSLSAGIAAYANDYRILNKKEVELCISKPGKEFRILFDREDYERVKAYRWRCKSNSNGSWIICVQTGVPLTKMILNDPSARINKIARDDQGRMDFRKKMLTPGK
jgi:hypothetical protein